MHHRSNVGGFHAFNIRNIVSTFFPFSSGTVKIIIIIHILAP